MEILILLIGCSTLIALIFLFAFVWSVRSGQYDDTYTPSVRMLFDDTPSEKNDEKNTEPITQSPKNQGPQPGK